MPEVLLHYAVIYTVLAPIIGVKRALLISVFAVVPDLDVLIYIHRSMSHSIVLLTILSLIVLVGVKKVNPKYLITAAIACLAMISHPILDTFQAYTPLLYPILLYSIHVNVEGFVTISSDISFRLGIEINTEPTNFTTFKVMDAPIFTSEGLIIAIILMVVPTAYLMLKKVSLRIK